MNTIQEGFSGFSKAIFKGHESQSQISDMKSAFYAGAVHMMSLNDTVADLNEDAAIQVLVSLQDEAADYFRSL